MRIEELRGRVKGQVSLGREFEFQNFPADEWQFSGCYTCTDGQGHKSLLATAIGESFLCCYFGTLIVKVKSHMKWHWYKHMHHVLFWCDYWAHFLNAMRTIAILILDLFVLFVHLWLVWLFPCHLILFFSFLLLWHCLFSIINRSISTNHTFILYLLCHHIINQFFSTHFSSQFIQI